MLYIRRKNCDTFDFTHYKAPVDSQRSLQCFEKQQPARSHQFSGLLSTLLTKASPLIFWLLLQMSNKPAAVFLLVSHILIFTLKELITNNQRIQGHFNEQRFIWRHQLAGRLCKCTELQRWEERHNGNICFCIKQQNSVDLTVAFACRT